MKKFVFVAVILAIFANIAECVNTKPPKSKARASSDSLPKLESMHPGSLQHSQSLRSAMKSPHGSPGASPSPSPGIRKTISFNDIPTRIDAPPTDDEDSLFWMNKKEFIQIVQQKSRVHKPQSLQTHFLNSLAIVMQNNYLMFEKLFKYGLGFDTSDTILDQSEVTKEHPIPFPDTKTIEKLQKEKDAAEVKLVELYSILEPAYLLNEELYNMMKNNYNAKTEINQKQFDELNKESVLVNDVFDRFDAVFKDFPIKTYLKYLKHIRRTMSQYEQDKISLQDANMELVLDVAELAKCYPNLKKALDTATGIRLEDAQAAIKNFHALVKKVLKVDKIPSTSGSFKKMLSALKLTKGKSKK